MKWFKFDKTIPVMYISGAGVISVESSEIFSSEKGKRQLDTLKRIHERRKQKRQPERK